MGVRERLLEILPEIEWIGDADLREKVIATWIDGLERGGWQPKDVDRMPFTLAKSSSSTSIGGPPFRPRCHMPQRGVQSCLQPSGISR
jgi:hypothetical protein